MLHGILQLLDAEDVHVQVMCAVVEVAVEHVHEVARALLEIGAQGRRVDRLGVGDAVEGVLVRELCHGVEGSQKAVLLGSVGGVSTRCERSEGGTTIGQGTRRLAVDHVRGDGQDRGRGLGVPVGVVLLDLRDEGLEEPHSNVVCTVIVVAVAREVALDLVVDNEAGLVADGLHLCILDGGKGVHDMAEAGDAGREGAAHIGVDQRHLCGLVVVLVMHVLDEVQDVHVEACEPIHHQVELVHDLVVVEILRRDRGKLGADLHVVALLVRELRVLAAVDGIVQALCEVGAGTEELHLLAGLGSRHAAADGIVISPDRTHHIVVLILDGAGRDGDLGGIAAEVLREALGVEDREVRLGGRTHVPERVEEAEVVLGDHVAAVHAKSCHLERGPDRVAGEELVVGRDAGKLDHAELQHEVVDKLLCFLLGDLAGLEVALDVDVEEGRDAAHGHGGTVLGLDGGKVAEVEPLDCLMGIGCRLGDVVAIDLGHLLHALEGTDLLCNLLALADDVVEHRAVAAVQ